MKIEGSLLVVVVCPVLAIIQDPSANTIVFLQKLKEDLQKFTNMDLDSYEGQVILKDKFHISKWIRHRYTCVPHPEPLSLLPPHICASDIRTKLQQLQQQDPVASLDEVVQTATNIFYKREQERKAKAQERERGRDKECPDAGHPPGNPYDKPWVLEGQGMRQMPNL